MRKSFLLGCGALIALAGCSSENTPDSAADAVEAAARLIHAGGYRQGSRIDRLDEDSIMSEVVHLYRRLQAV